MRCWDALLSEGAKVLYRVALALLKTHEELLLTQDNAGYVLREMKLACTAMHDRDALLKVSAPAPMCLCCNETETLLREAPPALVCLIFIPCIPTTSASALLLSMSISALHYASSFGASACSCSREN